MRKIIIVLFICVAAACKKDTDKTLTAKTWVIESATVSPAMTLGAKTTTNYIELMGPNSCVANMMINFSTDGTYSMSSNGALCDMYVSTDIKTWRRDGEKVILSANGTSPMLLKGDKLTQTTTSNAPGGVIYTIVYVYKAQSK